MCVSNSLTMLVSHIGQRCVLMQVYKPLHHLSVSLKVNGLRVGVGLGLDLSQSLSLLGLILFPFFCFSAHFGSARWALNKQPVGAFNVQPVGLHNDRYMQPFSPHISQYIKPYIPLFSSSVFQLQQLLLPSVFALFFCSSPLKFQHQFLVLRKGKLRLFLVLLA